jgi:hypothetical protein
MVVIGGLTHLGDDNVVKVRKGLELEDKGLGGKEERVEGGLVGDKV